MSPPSPPAFRFLDLPTEIRLIVYQYYYGNLEIEVIDFANGRFGIVDTPDTDIEYVSRIIGEEARQYRHALPVKLTLEDYGSPKREISYQFCFEEVVLDCLRQFARSQITTWIIDVEFEYYNCHTSLPQLLHHFPSLQRVELIERYSGQYDGKEDYVVENFSSDWVWGTEKKTGHEENNAAASVIPHDNGHPKFMITVFYRMLPPEDDQ